MGLFSQVLVHVSVVLLAGLLSPVSGAEQATTFCLPAHGFAEDRVSTYRRFVTATDSETVASRERKDLPGLSDSTEVYLVTDELVCQRASQAHEKVHGPLEMTASTGAVVQVPWEVWVIRVGPTRYIVFDGQLRGPARILSSQLYDQNFNLLAIWVH